MGVPTSRTLCLNTHTPNPTSQTPNPKTPTSSPHHTARPYRTREVSTIQNSVGHPRQSSPTPIQNSRGLPFLHYQPARGLPRTRSTYQECPTPPTQQEPPSSLASKHDHQTATPTRLQQVTAYPPSNRPPLPRPRLARLPPPSHRVSQHPSTSMSATMLRTGATTPLTPTTKTLKRSPASGVRLASSPSTHRPARARHPFASPSQIRISGKK